MRLLLVKTQKRLESYPLLKSKAQEGENHDPPRKLKGKIKKKHQTEEGGRHGNFKSSWNNYARERGGQTAESLPTGLKQKENSTLR